jgi:hypothetical protein
MSTSHCRKAGLGGSRSCEWCILSGVKGGSTADVCGVQRSSCKYLYFVFADSRFVGVIRDLRYTNSLTTSSVSRPTKRIVPSFRAAIIYFVFCLFIFSPLNFGCFSFQCFVSIPNGWLTPTDDIYIIGICE